MMLNVGEKFVPLYQPPGQYEHFALHGGRGGGKSHAAAEASAIHSFRREERVVCARQFQNSIKDSSKELIEKKIHELGMAVYYNFNDQETVNVSNGSRFTYVGLERNPASTKSLEGATLVWVEEAATVSAASIEVLIPTVRKQGSRFIWTWNPDQRSDEVDAMFRKLTPPEKSYIAEVNYGDNPHFYKTRLPSEMRRSRRVNPQRAGHIWDGFYDENPDTAVFQNWQVGRPAIDLLKHQPRFGMDFGFGADPNFLVKVYVLEEYETIYIAEEASGYHIPNKALPDLMDTVAAVRRHEIVGDSSRPETIDYLESEGFIIRGSIKGAGSVKNGINFLLGYKLLVDPDCAVIANEIRELRWDTDKLGKPIPVLKPKQQDHGVDALRYAVEDLARLATDREGGVVYV